MAAIGTAVISTGLVKANPAEAYSPEVAAGAGVKTALNLKVNGKNYRIDVEHRNTLAEVLRDQLADRHEDRLRSRRVRRLHGDHRRHAHVLVQPARGLDGRQRNPHRRGIGQAATSSIRCRRRSSSTTAPQCGFCTSGQIMSGKALLLKNSKPTEAQARRGLSGNLCRCGNYNREVAAVLAAAAKIS